MRVIEKKIDINKIIKDLGDTDFSGSNKEQGKMVSLMNGLAFSDDPKANEFMKKLNDATTEISKEVLGGKSESIDRSRFLEGQYRDIKINVEIINESGATKLLGLKSPDGSYWAVITGTEFDAIKDSYMKASDIFETLT